MQIPVSEIIRSLETENPWWLTGCIPKRFEEMPRRSYFEPFAELVARRDVNRAVILMGPRRVGKTVMTQQLVSHLLSAGTPPQSIVYVSMDTPTYTNQSLQYFIDLHAEKFQLSADAERYVIFDEVQYLAKWEQHLKVLVDRNPQIKFVASGSAAAALKLASQESGAGRFTEFTLPPLTFHEYLVFVGRNDLAADANRDRFSSNNFPVPCNIDELNEEFINYINYGGYPEAVISPTIRSDAARYIKNDIIDKVLLRDLPQLYGITNIQELNKLFTTLAYQTGQEVSLESLSQGSGISKPTISRYIEYLEAAFLIQRVKRIDDTAKTFTRDRSFKVFLTNPSMRSALFSPVVEEDDAFGHLVETALFAQWFHSSSFQNLHYARWKRSGRSKVDRGNHGEIDFVYLDMSLEPSWFVEVKWSEGAHKRSECWHSIIEFVQNKNIKYGVFTTKSYSGSKNIADTKISIVPSALYCLVVGRNTAYHRGKTLVSGGPINFN